MPPKLRPGRGPRSAASFLDCPPQPWEAWESESHREARGETQQARSARPLRPGSRGPGNKGRVKGEKARPEKRPNPLPRKEGANSLPLSLHPTNTLRTLLPCTVRCLLNKSLLFSGVFGKGGVAVKRRQRSSSRPSNPSPPEAPPAGGPDPCGGGARSTGQITGTKLRASWAFFKLVSLTTG